MALNGYELDMMCEGLFDNIEDLLDFSTDDEALGMVDAAAAGGADGYQQIAPPPLLPVVAPASIAAVPEENKICDDINIAGEDWIANFLDDTNFDIDFPVAAGIMAAVPNNEHMKCSSKDDDDSLFQSFSPVSVLEEPNNSGGGSGSGSGGSASSSSSSFSSSSHHETICLASVGPAMMSVPARARSKRPRRAAPPHVTVPIVPPAADGPPAIPTLLPECVESFGETCPVPPMKKKNKKHHLTAGIASGTEDGANVRKCQHCGIQKTPQWRAGPMGPKTLCNACGVRYKSGRLFPEYRPAASPTFMPSVHSNSHKKVVEMRNSASQSKGANRSPSPEYPAAKNCDLLAYIRRRE